MFTVVEIAAAVARAMDDAQRGIAMAQAIRGLPGQVWVPLDDSLAEEATRLAAEHHLRGADAVYAAVVRRYETTLVTRDNQQLEQLQPALPVLTPIEALARLAEMARADEDQE